MADAVQAIDCIIEIVSMLVSFLVAFMGYRAYKVTSQKRYQYFTISFSFIGLGFLILFLTNILLMFQTKLSSFIFVFTKGYLIYTFFIAIGYLVLAILAVKITNNKAMLLLLFTIIIALVFATNQNFVFHLITVILLAFIALHFFLNYHEKKTHTSFLVFLSFIFMIAAHILLLIISYSPAAYIISSFLQLFGFLVLFYVIIRCLLNARKKNKTGNNK